MLADLDFEPFRSGGGALDALNKNILRSLSLLRITPDNDNDSGEDPGTLPPVRVIEGDLDDDVDGYSFVFPRTPSSNEISIDKVLNVAPNVWNKPQTFSENKELSRETFSIFSSLSLTKGSVLKSINDPFSKMSALSIRSRSFFFSSVDAPVQTTNVGDHAHHSTVLQTTRVGSELDTSAPVRPASLAKSRAKVRDVHLNIFFIFCYSGQIKKKSKGFHQTAKILKVSGT